MADRLDHRRLGPVADPARLLLVWSATKPRLADAGDDPNAFFKRHLLNLAIGLVLCAVVTVVDYRALRAYAPFVYIASCLGLVAVLLVGTTINGAHSWIVIGGGFQIQPSEFAKVAAGRRDGACSWPSGVRTKRSTARPVTSPLVAGAGRAYRWGW